jgi:eukaryotic-like serine/threonine-protein kinase
MRRGKWIYVGLVGGFLLGLSSFTSAGARPKYARAEGKSCAYCHVGAAGGGARNYRGAFYQANKLTFNGFDDAAEAKKAGAEVGPDASPPPKSLTAPGTTAPTEPAPPPVDLKAPPDFGEVTLDGIVFVKIPAGTYRRGTTDAQKAELEKLGLWNRLLTVEQPAREVRITRPFLIGKFEVTQAQWEAVMPTGPRGRSANQSAFKGKDLPVETVTRWEAEDFCKRLGDKSKAKYRLPTEAEWEYAARAGDDGPFGRGADKTPITKETLDQYAWMNANSGNKTHPVGGKKPNAWGLHDMLGNVWEWCQDAYGSDAYAATPEGAENPAYWNQEATEYVLRGGCWFLDQRAQRVALRGGNLPTLKNAYVGFRVVRELP